MTVERKNYSPTKKWQRHIRHPKVHFFRLFCKQSQLSVEVWIKDVRHSSQSYYPRGGYMSYFDILPGDRFSYWTSWSYLSAVTYYARRLLISFSLAVICVISVQFPCSATTWGNWECNAEKAREHIQIYGKIWRFPALECVELSSCSMKLNVAENIINVD